MFQGTIPQDTRSIMRQVVEAWPVSDIYVGCSGNFTVERVLADLNRFRIHSCDVTIYTSVLGAFLSGQTFRMELRDDCREMFGWLEPYLTPVDRAATVMLATRLVEGLQRDGSLKQNPYFDRMRTAFQAQWPQLHAATVEKLNALTLRLASYHCGDVVPWAQALPPDVGFISYPPFWSGGYEAMFSKLDLLFDWDKPSYQDIGQDVSESHIHEYLSAITNRRCWLFGSNHLWPDYREFLCGVTQTSNRGMPIFVYASEGPRRIVMPQQAIEPVLVPRLMRGDTLGDHITLSRLTQPQFQALRSQYLNPGIKPGQASDAFAVLVDGKLVGSFAFSAGGRDYAGISEIYLLSDFPVAPTDYPRLSKLVLYAALSQEGKLLAERLTRHRVRTLFTTAFSNKPVSMKYRGLFDLVSRKDNPNWTPDASGPGAAYQQRYLINYEARMGTWTLAEGLALWKAKYGERTTGHHSAHHSD